MPEVIICIVTMLRVHHRWLKRCLLFVLGFLIGLELGGAFVVHLLPQVEYKLWAAEQPIDRGMADYQAGEFAAAIAQWQAALTQAQTVSERVTLYSNLGQAYRQIGRPETAIQQWEAAIRLYQEDRSRNSEREIAQLLTEQAQAYNELGQHQVALERSQAAIALAQKNKDHLTEAAAEGILGTAYQSLGALDKALAAHQTSLTSACSLNHANFTATALNNLGMVFVSRAERFRYQAQAAQQEGESIAATNFNQLEERNLRIAIAAFQQSAEVSRSVAGTTETAALLNLNRLLKEFPQLAPLRAIPELTCAQLNLAALLESDGRPIPKPPAGTSADRMGNPFPTASALSRQARSQLLTRLAAQPNSRAKAFAYINLANQLLPTATRPLQSIDQTNTIALLQTALTVARSVNDKKAESFAVGTLGRVYELNHNYEAAIDFTRQAQVLAQSIRATDSLYRWQWQSGRIFTATGQRAAAIAAYDQAIATLQTIRSDLILASKDLQFDFRDAIEPVYREFLALLLANDEQLTVDGFPRSQTSSKSLTTAANSNLEKVLNILELFKLAELQNFFGDDCVEVAQDGIAADGQPGQSPVARDPQAVIIYTIVLSDRSYEIVQFPNGNLKKYTIQLSENNQSIPASRAVLDTHLDRLRALLEKRSTEEYLTAARMMYQALIRPLMADLQVANPTTLVFVNDSSLRKVPMAALHDGQRFLVEKYAIATTPSLTLTSRRPLNRDRLRALVMGLTLEQPPFAALPNVQTEVQEVHQILGGTKLLDQDFTVSRLKDRLTDRSYAIVHMATHGKFGGDADTTFLLTYRDRITLNTLDQVLQTRRRSQPVELLTLSACQTAAGDDRSALGIAGLAVRAGVKSAIATLWFINDEATVPLVEEFYKQLLKPGVTKAEALRQAQIKLIADIQYNHPAVWSSFILIGNWM